MQSNWRTMLMNANNIYGMENKFVENLSETELKSISGGTSDVGEWLVDCVGAGICAIKNGINKVDQALGEFFFGDHGWWG